MKELSTTIEFVCTQRGGNECFIERVGAWKGGGFRDMFNKVHDGLALRYHEGGAKANTLV